MFARLYMEARNAGVFTAQKYQNTDSRPKAPTERAKKLISLFDELNDDQRSRMIESIRYCTDISMFKLLTLLEDSSVTLAVEADGVTETLIGPDEDKELRVKYWLWEEKHGK